eukprot:TRINITY_DN68518_c0_g1_i1.p1 TRINITY_DN68518_c0_g1~~TRINITY_DN68518_c0_g1_i1.p1  ORF type:complete len:300 (-),score=68.75 TRINITY_DN68518_c0_g1_i1:51-950(-)
MAAADTEEMSTDRWLVPSPEHPTLAEAVAQAVDGTHIELMAGYKEELHAPLIVDKAIFVEGPGDCSSLIVGQESVVVAAGSARDAVLFRRVRFRMTGEAGLVGLVIAGGCTLEDCEVEATAVGIEVAARTGNAARLVRSVVRYCEVGISLAGGAHAAVLTSSRVERCTCGIAVTGLDVNEGWNDALGSLTDVTLADNREADLRLRGWSIREKVDGVVRQAPPGKEVDVVGWPTEQFSVVVPTDAGPVVLHLNKGRVNAALFEKEDEEDADDADLSKGPPFLECEEEDTEVLQFQSRSEP